MKKILTLLIITTLMLSGCSSQIPKDKTIQYVGQTIMASTYTDNLISYPEHLCVNFGQYNIELDIDLSDTIKTEFNSTYNSIDIKYMQSTSSLTTEIIISDNTELDNDNDYVSYKSSSYDINNTVYITVKQYSNEEISEEEYFVQDLIEVINECILYSNKNREICYLLLDGLGYYDLMQIDSFKNHLEDLEISYKGNDLSFKTNEDYLILHGYTNEKLTEKEDWNNLYNIENSDNIALQTEFGLYIIESSNKKLEDEFIELLGILKDDNKITQVLGVE